MSTSRSVRTDADVESDLPVGPRVFGKDSEGRGGVDSTPRVELLS